MFLRYPAWVRLCKAGDTERGVVNAVAFQPAVAEALPGLHAGEGVLDAGADLAVGGVVFLFPGGELGLAALASVRDDHSDAGRRRHGPVRRLVRVHAPARPARPVPGDEDVPGRGRLAGRGERRTTRLSPDDVGDWHHMFTLGVRVPDLFCRVEWGKEGAYRLWLEMSGRSWATADQEKGRTEYEVVESGPRRSCGPRRRPS